MTDENIKQSGGNLVYVSKHWGARNTGTGHANHEQWQGKVYFIKEGTDYSEEAKRIGQDRIMSLWYATGYSVDGEHDKDPLGLYGYNCRHNHHPWFEGVSELPKNQPEPDLITYNGKTYDYYAMTQKMRAMERSVRALKREKEALKALGEDTTEIDARIKRKRAEYKDFCKACGVSEKTNRMRYECGTADLKKTKAWKKYKTEVDENEFKANTLGASDKVGDGSKPVYIGQIDIEKTQEAVRYFGEQIRNSEKEHLYIIDKEGKVYYNEGTEDTVSIGNMDLTDCTVLHNHPKSNGILSFGKDDFEIIRTNNSSWYLVNECYSYYARMIKPMQDVSYGEYYREAMKQALIGEDYQHYVFCLLQKEGYLEYERKEINGKAKGRH